MSKSNLYHVISPTTNLSIYFSPHLAEAIAYTEKHRLDRLVDIHGDDGSRWKWGPHVMPRLQKVVMLWNRLDQEPLSEKFSKWLDEQYEKWLSNHSLDTDKVECFRHGNERMEDLMLNGL